MVQPGLTLGTILGQGEAEELFVPSGSAPLSFRAPLTCTPLGLGGENCLAEDLAAEPRPPALSDSLG